jgi:hypothetical protein
MPQGILMATKDITCNFIGEFKVGDNIARNAASLCKLVEANETEIFDKLIVVQAGSIVEAALDQIFYRAKNHTKEGVPSIKEGDRAKIAAKKIGRFKVIIDKMEEYKLLDELGADIYRELHTLREYRNRVHIQLDSELPSVSRYENTAFSKAIVKWALQLNVSILEQLIKRFPRPEHLAQHAHEIKVPTL